MKVSIIVGITVFIAVVKAQAPDTLWTRTYGGINFDAGYSLQETSDYGYIITGKTSSGISGIYLIKTDVTGDIAWTKVYQTAPLATGGRSVQQTLDGGYVVAGNHSGVWIIKTDYVGDTLWTRTFDPAGGDFSPSVIEVSDGGFVFIMNTQMGTLNDMRLIKLDSNGDFQWMKSYGYGWCLSLQQTNDGGFIISGMKNYDVIIIKTDDVGDTLWTKIYGEDFRFGWAVKQTFDGGYIIAGETNDDMFLIKTNDMGDSVWSRTYGGADLDYARSVWQTTDGGYFVIGSTQSFGADDWDMFLVRTDGDGDTIWTETIGGVDVDRGYHGQQTIDGSYIITGFTISFGFGDYDVWLVKLRSDVGIAEEPSRLRYNYGASIISGSLRLPNEDKCKVFDITGRVVMPDKIKPGIYFIEIDGVVTQKVIKIR